jgi:hypothetical protein
MENGGMKGGTTVTSSLYSHGGRREDGVGGSILECHATRGRWGGLWPRRQGQHPTAVRARGTWAAPSGVGQGIEWMADRWVWVTVLAI